MQHTRAHLVLAGQASRHLHELAGKIESENPLAYQYGELSWGTEFWKVNMELWIEGLPSQQKGDTVTVMKRLKRYEWTMIRLGKEELLTLAEYRKRWVAERDMVLSLKK